MNKKISQFDVATSLNKNDVFTIIQDGVNKQIAKDILDNSLSEDFATKTELNIVENSVNDLESKVDDNYSKLAENIFKGDVSVTSNLKGILHDQYDSFDDKINELEDKHDKDIAETNNSVQEWIDDIANKSSIEQLDEALNKIKYLESLVTELSKLIVEGSSTGEVPGYHTQSTATIFPLSGYSKGNTKDPLKTTDTLNEALGKLEFRIDGLSEEASGLMPVIRTGESTTPTDSTLYTSAKVKEDYVYKKGDNVPGYIKFLTGLQGGSTFRSGWDGEGSSLYPQDNKWNFEVDNLLVRGTATFHELVIDQIKATGGDILVSLADMKCTRVEDLENGFKCYFNTEDGTKLNKFSVNDQAICQKFDGKNIKRYWRLVIETGNDYIVLSKTDCEIGSAIPEIDDDIIQLGNRLDENRMNALMISARGVDGPRISFYEGINQYSLVSKDTVVIGKNSKFTGTLVQRSGSDFHVVPFYRGIWQSGVSYNLYDQVTHNGSLWIALRDGITTVPSEDNPDWQLQVAKGENGTPGGDTAKWVEVIGERLFLYKSPDYSNTPTPTALNLVCKIHNISNPTYNWQLFISGESPKKIGSESAISISPQDFATKTAILRCTVTEGSDEYYDETQLAKLADGAQGEDAYYVDLTNSSVTVPYDAAGTTPLVDFAEVYTDVYAYKGTSEIGISKIVPTTSEGKASVNISNNRVTLSSFTSDKAAISLAITLVNGMQIEKLWSISKTKNGEAGSDGVDAAYVTLVGEQVFKYDKNAVIPTPATIILQAIPKNVVDPQYSWHWSLAGANEWHLIDNEENDTFVVDPNGTYFTVNQVNEITFKVEVVPQETADIVYYDITTITKVRDGKDGEHAYNGILTNEAHTVQASYLGVIPNEEYAKAKTNILLYHGITKLAASAFTCTMELLNGVPTSKCSYNYSESSKTLQLTSLADDIDTVVIRVHFNVDNTEVDTKDFTVTKAKAGAIGNQQVTIYAKQLTQPAAPQFQYRPSDGQQDIPSRIVWYLNPPTPDDTGAVWASTATIDPNQNGLVVPANTWQTPVRISGIDGNPGDSVVMVFKRSNTTPEKPTGTKVPPTGWVLDPATTSELLWMSKARVNADNVAVSEWSTPIRVTGEDGTPGEDGPSLVFRGDYDSTKTYGWTAGVRDVVYLSGIFYMWNKYYKGQTQQGMSPETYFTTTDGNRYASNGTTPAYWTRFGASFESVATNLLLANTATIAGWQFSNENIYSSSDTILLDGRAPISDTAKIHIAVGAAAHSNPSNANIQLLSDGTLKANKVDIEGVVNATSGFIGGFQISSGRLGVNSLGIGPIFSNALIGINATNRRCRFLMYPDSAGACELWDNTAKTQYSEITSTGKYRKIGMDINIANADVKLAMKGTGHLLLNGSSLDYKVYTPTVPSSSTTLVLSLSEGNKIRLRNPRSSDTIFYKLPSYTEITNELGIPTNTNFTIPLYITISSDTVGGIRLYGRQSGDNTKTYPRLVSVSGNRPDFIGLHQLDSVILLLTYEYSSSGSEYFAHVQSEKYAN